jgi:hypothetical protein
MKDPIQVRPPPRYLFLVVLRVDKSRDRISFALLDDVPLDRRHGSAVRFEALETDQSKGGSLMQLTTSTA